MQSGLVIAFFLGALVSVQGQVTFLGDCPTHEVVQNFDAGKYIGKWFEHEKYYAIFEAGGRCSMAEYSANPNGTIGVKNSMIKNEEWETIEGYARNMTADGSAKFGVTFPGIGSPPDAPYWVLDTDYTSYSIVWSCTEYGVINYQFLWVLVREQLPRDELVEDLHAKLEALEMRRDLILHTNQTMCE